VIRGNQAPSRTIIVEAGSRQVERQEQVVIYVRVSYAEDKENLERQAERLAQYRTVRGYAENDKERYTSRARFLDRDEILACEPARTEEPRFSGNSFGRWYYASGKRIMHSDVNGSYNIGRKVVPTAFDGPGIAAPAVRPSRLAV
jgi:hypothetical protein